MAQKIDVRGIKVSVFSDKQDDYISLSDIAKYKDGDRGDYILQNWMRNRSTIEFIGLWEQLHNPDFNSIEFDGFKHEAGANSFSLTPKRWITTTNAIGIISKAGRYGGTYAHRDIAFEFASWISAEFKLYLLKEFQRLKQAENEQKNLEWNVSRTLAKVNYHIHTESIKTNIIPSLELNPKARNFAYANEADILNLALFGKTASDWRKENPELKGNIRDYATLEQLVVLSNLESFNAELIEQGLSANDRFQKLNLVAVSQMKILIENKSIEKLKQLK
ncbi:KilA-N domain-containing protein [Xenorhabdus sp. DI]|uniref:KilA-N domain-containing protein n=1 Tax=Xenorhabdus doucetiae TaxID=351671 RepID=UPI0019903C7A|nr:MULTISPECIES: KilA-N domain-containing protein [unclassified Xenorhabdus]MBD2785266.1 KilA-N domain-containing protein [Xenorhabdus sp. 3]MBD2789309.1 KilA-N domain-containing protein [Xenorhabdus sp. DI]